ncbi:MAG TPA: hypothetical protein VK611_16165 [Acidimicrobiales bacterium]|nr:hypothetical protein [Acidimicrobiales bacterium]
MTDALDRSVAPGNEPEPDGAAQVPAASPPPVPLPASRPEHWFLAALLLGAGLIHASMAPSHLGEAAVEGAGFVAAAWAQLLLAVAVLLRPTRRVLVAVVVTSAALILAWVVSRTVGLPFGEDSGHAATVSLVDGVCVAVEAVALLLAGGLALGAVPAVPRIRGVAIAGAIGAVVFATAAISSPSARDHAAGSHGSDGHGAAGHDDGAAAGGGHGHGAATEGDDLGFSALSNGHQHENGVEPMTSEDTVSLAKQLAVTAELVEKYPTIAAAEAAGWRRAGPFSPGLGTHYGAPDYHLNPDGTMDTREDLLSPMLVFDGLGPDAKIAGFMYLAYGTEAEPEGFSGPNDHWHYHEKVCIVSSADGGIDTPFGADLEGVTEQMCTEAGGAFIDFTGYMVHVWNVPGYESPNGMFTELNPAISCPDGSYYRIPTEELGTKKSVCKNA